MRDAGHAALRCVALLMLVLGMAACGDRSTVPQARDAGLPDDAADLFVANFARGFAEAGTGATEGATSEGAGDRYRFESSRAAQQRHVAEFVAAVRRDAGPEEDTIVDFIASGEAIAGVHRAMRDAGLDPADVADTLAMLYATAWRVVNDAPVSARDIAAVRHDAVRVLEHDPKMRMQGDAQREHAADLFAMQTAVLRKQYALLRDRGSADDLQAYREQVRRTWQAGSGLDLRSVRIDSDGFVER